MVLESFLNPLKAEKKPWELFFLGFLYASVALFLSLWIFSEQAGLVTVFFIVMAALPLFYHTMRYEEKKDMFYSSESRLLKEHGKAIYFFIIFFIGITFAMSFWYVFLPAERAEAIFHIQIQTINKINSSATGNFMADLRILNKIFLNNVKVMIFSIIFSFLYGSGAIFILTWNSSVISAAIGNFFRTNIAEYAQALGLQKMAGYFHIVSLSLLRYSIHGIPEILAYFVAGLAGGILSVAIMKKDYKSSSFETILIDFSYLVIISVAILLLASFLEVFVTPIFFR